MQEKLIWLGEWLVNPDQNTLTSSAEAKKLEHKPMQVLMHLIEHAGALVTKKQLVDAIWSGRAVSDDAIVVAVSQIRKALSDKASAPDFIKTVPGKGYCLIAKVRIESTAQDQNQDTCTQLTPVKHKQNVQQQPIKPSMQWQLLLLVFLSLVVAMAYFRPFALPDKTVTQNSSNAQTQTIIDNARELLNRDKRIHWQQALVSLEQALEQGLVDAVLYLLIAEAKFKILAIQYHELDEKLPEYRALLERAYQLDNTHADIHLALARLYFLADWHYQKAEHYFRQAIKLAPNKVNNHFNYVNFLLAVNRFPEAKAQIKLIRQTNPHAYSLPMMAWVLNMQRHYDEAMKETKKLLTLNPNRFAYHWSAQSINENRGKNDKALQHMLKLLAEIEYSLVERAQLHAMATEQGLAGVYHWLLHIKRETRDIGQYQPPLSFARYALESGDKALALDYLEQALAIRQMEVLWLNVDPKYDPLRDEPRFQTIITQLGLATNQ